MNDIFSLSISIHADASTIWRYLTEPELMKLWMGEREMQIEIHTDWKVNSPTVISGVHHGKFNNSGVVLCYDELNQLSYSHLSSVSRLPDLPENYSVITFSLVATGELTTLTIELRNFATESIQKHLEFYWNTTAVIIKNTIENHIL
jgi:uncharacterized protein YndB with AHSA1/START domain